MKTWLDSFLTGLDVRTQHLVRSVARQSSRRSFLCKAGAMLLGSSLLPVLPFDRGFGAALAAEIPAVDDPHSCTYWRYCALDGILCNECGGTITSCPPGADAAKVSWVGTCHNPHDGKDYLVSYYDCCGKAMCKSKECLNSEHERPGYRMGLHNDINWCMANTSKGYHCTVAVIVGLAEHA